MASGWRWGEKEKCICAVCSKEFLIAPSSKRKVSYCSPECRNELRMTSCDYCGKKVKRSLAKKNGGKDYCSEECTKRIANLRHDKRIYRNGKPDLSINLFSLFKRDDGICKLCGRMTRFTGDIQSEEYPSIDHIIPISKGGKHEWNNVQLAHRGCNDLKSDKIAPASSFF